VAEPTVMLRDPSTSLGMTLMRCLQMPDAPLLCPRCNLPLEEVRTSGGVFYACNRCGGRAVTIELLRKRFTPESINPLWLHAVQREGRIGLPCPLCRQPMIDVVLSDQAGINVDVCAHCHFVWFDVHEVEALVPRQPQPPAPELPQKARELLAIAEVERLSKQAEGSDFDSAAPEESWKQIAAFFGYQWNLVRRKSRENRGQHGCFRLLSFARVSWLFHICAGLFNDSD
jgi:Zn-finger nucleic acid-binding protein